MLIAIQHWLIIINQEINIMGNNLNQGKIQHLTKHDRSECPHCSYKLITHQIHSLHLRKQSQSPRNKEWKKAGAQQYLLYQHRESRNKKVRLYQLKNLDEKYHDKIAHIAESNFCQDFNRVEKIFHTADKKEENGSKYDLSIYGWRCSQKANKNIVHILGIYLPETQYQCGLRVKYPSILTEHIEPINNLANKKVAVIYKIILDWIEAIESLYQYFGLFFRVNASMMGYCEINKDNFIGKVWFNHNLASNFPQEIIEHQYIQEAQYKKYVINVIKNTISGITFHSKEYQQIFSKDNNNFERVKKLLKRIIENSSCDLKPYLYEKKQRDSGLKMKNQQFTPLKNINLDIDMVEKQENSKFITLKKAQYPKNTKLKVLSSPRGYHYVQIRDEYKDNYSGDRVKIEDGKESTNNDTPSHKLISPNHRDNQMSINNRLKAYSVEPSNNRPPSRQRKILIVSSQRNTQKKELSTQKQSNQNRQYYQVVKLGNQHSKKSSGRLNNQVEVEHPEHYRYHRSEQKNIQNIKSIKQKIVNPNSIKIMKKPETCNAKVISTPTNINRALWKQNKPLSNIFQEVSKQERQEEQYSIHNSMNKLAAQKGAKTYESNINKYKHLESPFNIAPSENQKKNSKIQKVFQNQQQKIHFVNNSNSKYSLKLGDQSSTLKIYSTGSTNQYQKNNQGIYITNHKNPINQMKSQKKFALPGQLFHHYTNLEKDQVIKNYSNDQNKFSTFQPNYQNKKLRDEPYLMKNEQRKPKYEVEEKKKSPQKADLLKYECYYDKLICEPITSLNRITPEEQQAYQKLVQNIEKKYPKKIDELPSTKFLEIQKKESSDQKQKIIPDMGFNYKEWKQLYFKNKEETDKHRKLIKSDSNVSLQFSEGIYDDEQVIGTPRKYYNDEIPMAKQYSDLKQEDLLLNERERNNIQVIQSYITIQQNSFSLNNSNNGKFIVDESIIVKGMDQQVNLRQTQKQDRNESFNDNLQATVKISHKSCENNKLKQKIQELTGHDQCMSPIAKLCKLQSKQEIESQISSNKSLSPTNKTRIMLFKQTSAQ